jgi:hypothetical protein
MYNVQEVNLGVYRRRLYKCSIQLPSVIPSQLVSVGSDPMADPNADVNMNNGEENPNFQPPPPPPDVTSMFTALMTAVTALTLNSNNASSSRASPSPVSAELSLKDLSFLYPRPGSWEVESKKDDFLTIQSYLTILQDYYKNLRMKLDDCVVAAYQFFPKTVQDYVRNPSNWSDPLDGWAEFQSRVIATIGQLDPLPTIAGKLMNLSFAASKQSLSVFCSLFKKRFEAINQSDGWRIGPNYAVHLFLQHLPVEYRTKLDTVKSHGVPWPNLVELFTHIQSVALVQGWSMDAPYVSPTARTNSGNNVPQSARMAKHSRTDKRYCTHCKSSTHNTGDCFILHPELKDKYMKNRARNSGRVPVVPVITKDTGGKGVKFADGKKK